MKPLLTCLIAALLLSCQSSETSLPKGTWGGQGISMVVEDAQVGFEFDCALGEIAQTVQLKDNKFTVEGTFSKLRGGAIPVGWQPTPEPAVFEGVLSGNTLTLGIKLKTDNQGVGTFQLTKDTQGQLHRCL